MAVAAGLLLFAIVGSAVQRFSTDVVRIRAETETLVRISDQTRELMSLLAQADEVQGEADVTREKSKSELTGSVRAVQTRIANSAINSALEKRVARLMDAVDRWRLAFIAGTDSGASDQSVLAEELRNARAQTAAIGSELQQLAGNLIAERIAVIDAKAMTFVRDAVVAFGLTLMAVLLSAGWRRQRLLRRIRQLPGRFERQVFDKAPTGADAIGAARHDPVDLLAADLGNIATRVRARLTENEKIERMAFSDVLTGLPNRRGLLAFLDVLGESGDGSEDDSKIGLIHIDLDHFKTINDTMGHDAGDTVLREATKRMSTAIRDTDLLARLGGDEFLVVATGVECEADLTRIADRLIAQFETPILYQNRACHVGASMGLVLGGQRGPVRDPKRLLINADLALFRAKALGRGQYAIFNSAMADEARRRNERSIALGQALQDESFRPWFQPVLDLSQQKVVGMELLCRWHDKTRGVLMPHDFLEDAEANSLMEDIGLQVLEHAISALHSWRMSGVSVPAIHLNLSRTQLLSSSFVDRFSWTLDEANLPPGQFAVEIDERDCSARGSEVAFANVKRLRALGLQIVLDNFGADQASLSLLTPLQAKVVKCSSQTFERLLASQSANSRRDVLAAIDHAARAFGITISAKDVETSEQSKLFRDAGICMQQGDYLAGVLNVEDTGKYLRGGFQAVPDLALKAS